MSAALDLLFQGADKLATRIADAISEETGLSEKITYPIAKQTAEAWVKSERAAVTKARAEALALARKRK